jgi:hypothetical protein
MSSSSPHESSGQDHTDETARAATAAEWVGSRGDKEPDACAAMTPAERIEMVWPITVTAWDFSGKPWDESRLRRDVESLGRRKR